MSPQPSRRSRRAAVTVTAALALLAPAGVARAGGGSDGGSPLSAAALDAATIPQLEGAMDAHRLTAVQLARAYLQRIRTVDPKVGAVLAVNPHAVQEAAASDRVRRHSGARSPLEGIPVLLKDNVDATGTATTAGSRALAASRPSDATLTRELRAAGAVVLGKANLSEWANFRSTHATSGWSGVGGQTNNPYVLDRNPCGSSSGSAAGVAASLAQVAIGTETDGSIVCPSGANGDVGIKPTLGMVSRTGVVPISDQQDTPGPIARHAVDAALTLQVISGKDPRDAATATRPAGTDVDFADLAPGALAGKRIGVWDLVAADAVDPATTTVFETAVKQLEADGAEVVHLGSLDDAVAAFGADETLALDAEFHQQVNSYLAGAPGPHPADLAGLIAFDDRDPVELVHFGQEIFTESQATAPADQNPAAQAARQRARTAAQALIDGTLSGGHLDAIVALTNIPAWKTTYFKQDGQADAFGFGSSSPAAVAGYPDITVPAGFAGPDDALPIGISFFGAQWDDADLLDLAAAYEDSAHARRAPTYLPTVG
jgi:amidase